MTDEPPPPAYSSHDPYDTTSVPVEPTGLIAPESTGLSAPWEGANSYFASRPPYPSPPSRIISHRIVLQPGSGRDEIPLPSKFSDRGVDEQDWFTFLNHLFPDHVLTGNNQKDGAANGVDGKPPLYPSTEKANGLADLGLPSAKTGSENSYPEKSYSRRANIHKAVKEWNTGFFEPRGLLVIAKTPVQLSPKVKDLNSRSIFGDTIITTAATKGDFNVVEGLLLQGADPDSSALYGAAMNKHPSVVELLIQHGAKVDTKPSTTHLVASQGNLRTLAVLLKYGANPNHKDWTGNSPLFDAAMRGDISVLKLLLAYGADPNYASTGGHSALYHAIQRRDTTVIQLLLDHEADPNQRPWTGQPCIHLAASQGDAKTIEALLSKGADINATPTMGETALGSAIYRDDNDMALLLLEKGADVNIKPLGGQSPLFLVASKENQILLRLLLEKGANVDESPPGYPSALYMAIHREDLETAKVLLEFGANASAGNSLNVAVDHGNVDAVKLLLDHGADPNSKPTGGQTPLYRASSKGDLDLMQLLLEKGAKVEWSPPGFPTALYSTWPFPGKTQK
ncbi:hypothetical protein V494_00848 [Pseudogymnoascus sp. VKM F-4513 (FW-928)]|nr:hypothetical protein V494_00848 [Pseudogymnoascus sp. VKM F-4513 (FW-928)]